MQQNHIAGRLSSHVAKLLIQGNRVTLVNCEKIMYSGTRDNLINEYKAFLEINSIIHPQTRTSPLQKTRYNHFKND